MPAAMRFGLRPRCATFASSRPESHSKDSHDPLPPHPDPRRARLAGRRGARCLAPDRLRPGSTAQDPGRLSGGGQHRHHRPQPRRRAHRIAQAPGGGREPPGRRRADRSGRAQERRTRRQHAVPHQQPHGVDDPAHGAQPRLRARQGLRAGVARGHQPRRARRQRQGRRPPASACRLRHARPISP